MKKYMSWIMTFIAFSMAVFYAVEQAYISSLVAILATTIALPIIRPFVERYVKRPLEYWHLVAASFGILVLSFGVAPKALHDKMEAHRQARAQGIKVTNKDVVIENTSSTTKSDTNEVLDIPDKQAVFKEVYACDKKTIDQTTKELGKWEDDWEVDKKANFSERRSTLLNDCRGQVFKKYKITQKQFFEIEREAIANKWSWE